MLIAINYHYIKEQFNFKYPSIFGATPEQFRNQLKELKKQGEFISPNDLVSWVGGSLQIPEKSFIVTFDDGLKEQYELALPILNELDIPAVFFANTHNLEGKVSLVHKIHFLRSEISPLEIMEKLKKYLPILSNADDINKYSTAASEHYKYDNAENALLKYVLNLVLNHNELEEVIDKLFAEHFGNKESEIATSIYMSEDELKHLSALDYLGSHAHKHLPVGQLSIDEKEYQAKHSQEVLTKITGKNVAIFSYPYGSKSASTGMDEILKDNGYSAAFTMERAVNNKVGNPFLLSRFDNNDVTAGKAWKFGSSNPFDVLSNKTWFNEV